MCRAGGKVWRRYNVTYLPSSGCHGRPCRSFHSHAVARPRMFLMWNSHVAQGHRAVTPEQAGHERRPGRGGWAARGQAAGGGGAARPAAVGDGRRGGTGPPAGPARRRGPGPAAEPGGGGQTPSIWHSGRSSRPACGAAASRSAMAGSASRCCNCEAADGGLRQPAQQPGGPARQPQRRGLDRAGGARAAARRWQCAGTDLFREAGEPHGGAAQPRPEQQHQRHGEAQFRRRGRRWRGAAPRSDRRSGRPGRGKRGVARQGY